jgi:hypothetical protein
MGTTVESLKKDTEKVFAALSPEEKARYVSDQMKRISEDFSTGKDTSSNLRDLDQFGAKYVSVLPRHEYIPYLQTLKKLETDKLAGDLLFTHLIGLQRETDLLGSVIELIRKIQNLSADNTRLANLANEPVYMVFPDSNKLIAVLQERRDKALKEIEEIKGDNIWEIIGLTRPVNPIYETARGT